MSYIYKITNDINNKIYIGKTNLTIKKRFYQHCVDSKKSTMEKRPLYNAMNKYGIEHFYIEQIEKCLPNKASEREKYWITFYKSYENGYNATTGGDGKTLYDYQEIANRLKEHPYAKDIAKQFGCCKDTVYSVAKNFHIPLINKGNKNVNTKRTVHQYTKNGKYVQSFESIQAAVEWCYQQGLLKTINSGARSHISEVANGKRKSAYTYYWKYD